MTQLKNNDELINKINVKVQSQVTRLAGGIPYIPVDGVYQNMADRHVAWWTNGFWSGLLWQLYQDQPLDTYQEAANLNEESLDQALALFTDLNHDVGFMWLHTAVANYRITGNPQSKIRGLHAATLLAGRYNLRGEFIRCWNEEKIGWVIIDSLMNLPLLFWASKETGDPRYRQIAENHVNTVLTHMIRDDGSCSHIGVFDPESGEFIEELGGQGFASNSAWTRGQSWGLYGMVLAYKYTKQQHFLLAAKKIAHYFIVNVARTNWVPLVDFRGAETDMTVDTTAGNCAACGLLELTKYISENEKQVYQEAAEKIIEQTMTEYADWDPQTDGLIGGGTEAYHSDENREVSIIYGDYFFVEAILRLQCRAVDLW